MPPVMACAKLLCRRSVSDFVLIARIACTKALCGSPASAAIVAPCETEIRLRYSVPQINGMIDRSKANRSGCTVSRSAMGSKAHRQFC